MGPVAMVVHTATLRLRRTSWNKEILALPYSVSVLLIPKHRVTVVFSKACVDHRNLHLGVVVANVLWLADITFEKLFHMFSNASIARLQGINLVFVSVRVRQRLRKPAL